MAQYKAWVWGTLVYSAGCVGLAACTNHDDAPNTEGASGADKGGNATGAVGGTSGGPNSVGGTGGATPNGSGGSGGRVQELDDSKLIGVYRLRVKAQTGNTQEAGELERADIRLDLHKGDGSWRGVLSRADMQSQPVAVSVNNDEIQLTGPVDISDGCKSEEWTNITLRRDENGIHAEATARGSVSRIVGWGTVNPLTTGYDFDATLEVERGAPPLVAKIDLVRKSSVPGAEQPLLPWQPLQVRTSAGVIEASALSHLEANVAGVKTNVSWKLFSDAPEVAWSGARTGIGQIADWDATRGKKLAVALHSEVEDWRGSKSAASFSETADVVDIGAGAANFNFTQPFDVSNKLGHWGAVTQLAASEGTLCPERSCLQVGPVELKGSADPQLANVSGIAGQFGPIASKRVKFKYRFQASTDMLQFELQVAAAGGGVIGSFKIPKLTADTATDWQEVSVEIPDSASGKALGFAVIPNFHSAETSKAMLSCGIDAFARAGKASVFLESIRVEE